MKLQVYAVLDKAVGAFTRPFFLRTRGEAIRSFTEACQDEKTDFCKHPDDFVLYYNGVFDDNTGMFDSIEPERVIGAREVMSVAE